MDIILINGNDYFFFSSRRRHTRWPRDWSSDVCSSDLLGFVLVDPRPDEKGRQYKTKGLLLENTGLLRERSEERRVGKECKYRLLPKQQKEKMQLKLKGQANMQDK